MTSATTSAAMPSEGWRVELQARPAPMHYDFDGSGWAYRYLPSPELWWVFFDKDGNRLGERKVADAQLRDDLGNDLRRCDRGTERGED